MTLSIKTTTQIREWIRTEFLPLELATPNETIEQHIDSTIRYWNTHSAHRHVAMCSYSSGDKRVQLPNTFKDVAQVFPATTTTWIWNDHPLWTVLGLTILDNVTSDMIMMSEAFRNYRIYVGTDFQWTFEPSQDFSAGGYLYAINIPKGVSQLCVVGARRIADNEELKNEYILDWILRYSKELVRSTEGNTLRKSSIIDVKNDGAEMIREAKEEIQSLQKELEVNGRWFILCKRC